MSLIYNSETNQYVVNKEVLDKRTFDFYRQQIDKLRFYSNNLKGTIYSAYSDSNILGLLNKMDDTDFVFNKSNSQYSINTTINPSFNKSVSDKYNFGLSQYFSPSSYIDNKIQFFTVDKTFSESLSSTQFDALDYNYFSNLYSIKNDISVLVTNIYDTIILDSSVEPSTVFNTEFSVIIENTTTTTYSVFSNRNGLYNFSFNSKTFVKQDLFEYYPQYDFLVFDVLDLDKLYLLNRLTTGIFPGLLENTHISENTLSMIRYSYEYNNVRDILVSDVLYDVGGIFSDTFQIHERYLMVGDFGSIILYQDGHTSLIHSEIKEDFVSIGMTESFYYILSKNGLLLKIDRVTLDVLEKKHIDSSNVYEFTSFKLYNRNDSSPYVITTKLGGIYTNTGLVRGTDLSQNDLYSIVYSDSRYAYVGGDTGSVYLVDLVSNTYQSVSIQYNENIVDMCFGVTDSKRFRFTGTDYVDLSKTISNSDFSIDFNVKVVNINSGVILSSIPVKNATFTYNSEYGIKVEVSSGKFKLVAPLTGTTTTFKYSRSSVSANMWYNIFITRNSNVYRLYINGQLEVEITDGFSGDFNSFNNRIRLGAELRYNSALGYTNNSLNFFVGTLDKIRLWDKELTNVDIMAYRNRYDVSDNVINIYSFRLENNLIPTKCDITELSLILPTNSNIRNYNNNVNIPNPPLDVQWTNYIVFLMVDKIGVLTTNLDYLYSFSDYSRQLWFNFTDVDSFKALCVVGEYVFISDDNTLYNINISDIYLNNLDLDNTYVASKSNLNIILDNSYDKIILSVDGTKLILIDNTDEVSVDVLSTIIIQTPPVYNPTLDVEPIVIPDIVDSTEFNTVVILNDIRTYSVTDVSEIYYNKVFGYVDSATQSLVTYDLTELIGMTSSKIEPQTPLIVTMYVKDVTNGAIQISADNIIFYDLISGFNILEVVVGITSKLYFRAKLADSNYGNKVRGVVSDIKVYSTYDVNIEQLTYLDTTSSITKLYFPQFDTISNIANINDSLYNWVSIKKLDINNVDQLTLSNFGRKKLYNSDYATMMTSICVGGLCDYIESLNNDTIDRVRYFFDLSVQTNGIYAYNDVSYGLLEGLSNIFGLDKNRIETNISDNISNITYLDAPLFIGIDFSKDFEFETESLILFSDNIISDFDLDVSSIGGTVSSATPSSINGLYITGGGYTYSVTINDPIEVDEMVYIEFSYVGEITINIGDDTFNFTTAATSSVLEGFYYRNDTSALISNVDLYSVDVDMYDFIVTKQLPTKFNIKWVTDSCRLEFRLNGILSNSINSFILSNGGVNYEPTCEVNIPEILENNTSKTTIFSGGFWDSYEPRLLVLDYDVANKMYFFNRDGDYILPQPITILSNFDAIQFSSLDNQLSIIDVDKDIYSQLEYNNNLEYISNISYNTRFNNTTSDSVKVTYSGVINYTESISDLGDLIISGTFSGGSPSDDSFDFYYNDTDGLSIFVVKLPLDFQVNVGDIFNISTSFLNYNMLVNKIYEDMSFKYIYFIDTIDRNIFNRLKVWIKGVTITNLNNFDTLNTFINNYNSHYLGSLFDVIINSDGSITFEAKFTEKTAYYNMQFKLDVINSIGDIVDTKYGNYTNIKLKFKYGATYNILDVVGHGVELGAMPSVEVPTSQLTYDYQYNQLYFTETVSSIYNYLELYTFYNIHFGSNILYRQMITGKYYDENNGVYVVQLYDNISNLYDSEFFVSDTIKLVARNSISDVSSDLSLLSKYSTDTNNTYSNIKYLDINTNSFEYMVSTNINQIYDIPINTNAYAKFLLNTSYIKNNFTSILFTDNTGELQNVLINFDIKTELVVSGIEPFDIVCDGCVYYDYFKFNDVYNEYIVSGTFSYYGNRTDMNNRIIYNHPDGATYSSFHIDSYDNTNEDLYLYFDIINISDTIVLVNQGTFSTVFDTIGEYSIVFDGSNKISNPLNLILQHTDISVVDIRNIRIGNAACNDLCSITKIVMSGSHNLSVGDNITLNITEGLFTVNEYYISDLNSFADFDNGGTVSVTELPINGVLRIYDDVLLDDTYIDFTNRLSFEYLLESSGVGTYSITPFITDGINIIYMSVYSNVDLLTSVVNNFSFSYDSFYIGYEINSSGATVSLTISKSNVSSLSDLNNYYDGSYNIVNIIDDTTVVIDKVYLGGLETVYATYSSCNNCGDYMVLSSAVSDIGSVTYWGFDPYLKLVPLDVYRIGSDSDISQAVVISDYAYPGNSDINIEFASNKYRFRLVDDISLFDINERYPWILDANIIDGIIGEVGGKLVFYSGKFIGGRMFNCHVKSGLIVDSVIYDSIVEFTSLYSSVFKSGTILSSNINNTTIESGIYTEINAYNSIFSGGILNDSIISGGSLTNILANASTLDNIYAPLTVINTNISSNSIINSGSIISATIDSSIIYDALVYYALISKSKIYDGDYKSSNIVNSDIYGGSLNMVNVNNCEIYNAIVSDISIKRFEILSSVVYRFVLDGYYNIPTNYKLHINDSSFGLGDRSTPYTYTTLGNSTYDVISDETYVVVNGIPIISYTEPILYPGSFVGYVTDTDIYNIEANNIVYVRGSMYGGIIHNGTIDGIVVE